CLQRGRISPIAGSRNRCRSTTTPDSTSSPPTADPSTPDCAGHLASISDIQSPSLAHSGGDCCVPGGDHHTAARGSTITAARDAVALDTGGKESSGEVAPDDTTRIQRAD